MPVRRPILDSEVAALLAGARKGIAERLQQARLDADMSQADVAAAFNRAAQWISKIEKGEITPRADHLAALCVVLGADAGWVIAGDASGMSEFVSRMRALEPRLDARGRAMVLGAAEAAVLPAQLRAAEDRAAYGAHGMPDSEVAAAQQLSEEGADGDADGSEDAAGGATTARRGAGTDQGGADARGGTRRRVSRRREGGG
ncbi:MAG: helix-turn-helix domain-containing protein [Dehalococcoidia bacterium]